MVRRAKTATDINRNLGRVINGQMYNNMRDSPRVVPTARRPYNNNNIIRRRDDIAAVLISNIERDRRCTHIGRSRLRR